jgi:XTP/dITP diphosphohydrolase
VVAEAAGSCEGLIGFERRGSGGFGYDPLFVVPEYGKTMAELGLEIKNRISHRARALEELRGVLSRAMGS